MGGGKKQKPEVYDFLMSIDYALCYGPVDQVNQIWVKDKPIWCGAAFERTDVEVNQPDLFGGDTGEGGVVGTVEVYTGDSEQRSSAQLAGRVGRTIDNMPGYRDIAHLFFRGNLGAQEPVRLNLPLILFYLYPLFFEKARRGFRWSTNNPYLPEMKASVTRLPKSLPTNYAIYRPILDENGNPVEDPYAGGTKPEGLIDWGLPSGDVPTYYRADIPDQEGINPWMTSGFENLTNEQYDIGIEQGWDPRVEVISTRTFKNSAEEIVNSSVYFRLIEYAPGDVEIATHNFTADGLSPVFSEVVSLNPATRKIKYVMIVQSFDGLGNPIPSGVETADGLTQVHIKFKKGEGGPASGGIPWTTAANPSLTSHYETVDLYDLGFTQETIDAGGVSFAADAAHGAWESPIGGGSAHNWIGFVRFSGYGQNPDGTVNYSAPVAMKDLDGVVRTNFEHSATGYRYVPMQTFVVQPGTRYVSFVATKYLLLPIFAYTTAQRATWVIFGGGETVSSIHCNVDRTLGVLPDANPAQMIYESMTNPTFGKGEDPAMIDTDSFLEAAVTLRDEFFGLSMGWFAQDTIEKFIQEILDHIQAFLFQDPETGKWVLKLLRDDYTLDGVLHIDSSNADMSNQKRKAWGETVNEIVVSYTDPETEKEATVVSHNIGNVTMNGGLISETRNYYGIRNPILAKIVADRDVHAAGYPVFVCQAKVDRTFWRVRPGDVVTLSWPEEGLVSAVMRVMGVDYGSPQDRTITLDLSEDIFALEKTAYANSQQGLLETDRVEAEPLDQEMVITAPLPAMVQSGMTVEDIDADDPVVMALVMADSVSKPTNVQVHTEVVKANGGLVVEKVTTVPLTASSALEAALVPEVRSTVSAGLIDVLLRGNQELGDLLMIGDQEAGCELVMLDSFDSETEEWTIVRGVWDTVPVAWEEGTIIWAFSFGPSRADPLERIAGETRTYRLLPKTSFNRLPYELAEDVVVTFTERPFAPFRPANCQLDGTGFVGVDYSISVTTDPLPATIAATWSNRNRQTEDSLIPAWDEISVAPEIGQTTVLRIYNASGVFSHEITGLAGDSYDIPIEAFEPINRGTVQFVSERDGIRSLWGVHIPFDIRRTGYGLKYGLNYGI